VSAPQFDGQPMTKREVLIAREAYITGARAFFCHPVVMAGPATCRASDEVEAKAPVLYPLPKVTRPRERRASDGATFRVVGGELMANYGGGWVHEQVIGVPLAPLVADLLANPTEEVDE
jgi:hypothetical protein